MKIAFDRSMRSVDADGRLHVERTNISKAAVNPYYGREIPGWKSLGLEPDRIYQLLRCPKELARAAHTFNNLPVLSEHVPVTAAEHHPSIVVGSTGTDAAFDGDFLSNSLVVWAADSIERVDSGDQRELSCAYRYTPDMTPGEFNGVLYDGVMRDIVGNHVALVDEGRAGPDVVVADRKPKTMKQKVTSKLKAALSAYFDPRIAQDEDIDVDAVCKIIEAAQGEYDEREKVVVEDEHAEETVIEEIAEDEDSPREEAIAELMDYIKERLPAEEYEHAASLIRREATMDEDLPGVEGEALPDGPAMDRATVASMIAQAEKRGARRQADIEDARENVRPLVGKLMGMDSAASVYRMALKSVGYADADLKGAGLATLKAMTAREVSRTKAPSVAMDRAKVGDKRADFKSRYGVK